MSLAFVVGRPIWTLVTDNGSTFNGRLVGRSFGEIKMVNGIQCPMAGSWAMDGDLSSVFQVSVSNDEGRYLNG